MSWGNHHRNSWGNPMIALDHRASVGGAICDALRAKYGELKHAPKRLAALTGTTPRTAENWLAGQCAPQSAQLIALMAADPAMEQVVMELVHARRETRTA